MQTDPSTVSVKPAESFILSWLAELASAAKPWCQCTSSSNKFFCKNLYTRDNILLQLIRINLQDDLKINLPQRTILFAINLQLRARLFYDKFSTTAKNRLQQICTNGWYSFVINLSAINTDHPVIGPLQSLVRLEIGIDQNSVEFFYSIYSENITGIWPEFWTNF